MTPLRGLPRWVDVSIAVVAFVVGLPFIGVAAASLALSLGESAVYRQVRVGRHGKTFVLLKLRTMRSTVAGARLTSANDPRVTRVGALVRMMKIDELLQLLNVVAGDMALVGPRPELPQFVDLADPNWRAVLEVRPGITHPMTIRLRREDKLLARRPEDPEAYYLGELLPFKLAGYLEYERSRTWLSDVAVLARTLYTAVIAQAADPVTATEVSAWHQFVPASMSADKSIGNETNKPFRRSS